MNLESIKRALRRRAIVLEIGGFRPPENPLSSWFGKVGFAAAGEEWPESDGRPLQALCQINVTELPFRPPHLEDIEFLSVFIDVDDLPFDHPNGTHWCLRAYSSLAELQPLSPAPVVSDIQAFPMRPRVVEADYPCWEDAESELGEEIDESIYDQLDNESGLKLGGWPTLIQSEIYWAPYNAHPALPQYVFQIDSTEKGNWMWGDSGVGYFGRGTAPGHEGVWVCEWQCC